MKPSNDLLMVAIAVEFNEGLSFFGCFILQNSKAFLAIVLIQSQSGMINHGHAPLFVACEKIHFLLLTKV